MADSAFAAADPSRPQAEHGRTIQQLALRKSNNQSIVRLTSSVFYVHKDTRIFDVQDALRNTTNLQALAVVDDALRAQGIIVRRDFFAVMARPYAQDVFKNHPVSEVMSNVRTFRDDENLFTVAEDIDADMRSPGINYYLLVGDDEGFRGIFSSQDMLVYLSQITQNDIALARKLQSRIVKEREFIVGNHLEIVSTSRTAKGVGGDFYEIREYAPGRWMVAMCDVSGKGVAASIITSVLWGMMSLYDFTNGLVPFIRELNNYLVRTFETEKFVTAVFLDYDEASGRVTVCDMGHSHFYLFRDNELKHINTNQSNLPIGIVPDIEPNVDDFSPRQDDVLFVLTDGLIEQEDIEGREYDMNRVASVFQQYADQPVEVMGDRLLEDFNKFRGKRNLSDDVTYSIIRFAPQAVRL